LRQVFPFSHRPGASDRAAYGGKAGFGQGVSQPQNDCIDCIASSAIIAVMATITVRNLPEETKRRLRVRAAQMGHSMEEEARSLLETGLRSTQPPPQPATKSWASRIVDMFQEIGGAEDVVIPARRPFVPRVDFSGPEFGPPEEKPDA
jgi:antitoxin FitA